MPPTLIIPIVPLHMTTNQRLSPGLPHNPHKLSLSFRLNVAFQAHKHRPIIFFLLDPFLDRDADVAKEDVGSERPAVRYDRSLGRVFGGPYIDLDAVSTIYEDMGVGGRGGLAPELVAEEVCVMRCSSCGWFNQRREGVSESDTRDKVDRKSTRLNSSHSGESRMPSSA